MTEAQAKGTKMKRIFMPTLACGMAAAIVSSALIALARAPVEPRSSNEIAPFGSREWLNAPCRYHVLQDYGPYGSSDQIRDLYHCVAGAEIIMLFAVSVQRKEGSSPQDKDAIEARYHLPTKVEFFGDSDIPQACVLEPKKERFDQLPDFPSEYYLKQFSSGQPLDPELKKLLDANYSVTCENAGT
jgi:hypothetical protein